MFNLRSLDLNLLTVFEAIYESGTLTRGADRLALSQSATSHALARLREACGDELFVRAGQLLSPTPVARAMFPVVQSALNALRVSLSEARGFDPAQSQRQFHLFDSHQMAIFHILALRKVAIATAPGVVLRFDTRDRPSTPADLADALRDGLLDLAIDWMPVSRDQFYHRKLFDDRLMFVARQGHPRIGPNATIAELRAEEFVGFQRRQPQGGRPPGTRQFDELGMNEVVQVSEMMEMSIAAAGTDLIGLAVESSRSLLETNLGLCMIDIPADLPPVPVHMIWHESRRNDAGHRWLRNLVSAELVRYGREFSAPWCASASAGRRDHEGSR